MPLSEIDVNATTSPYYRYPPSKLVPRDDREIRERLLRSLGIFFQVDGIPSALELSPSRPHHTRRDSSRSCSRDDEEERDDSYVRHSRSYYNVSPVSSPPPSPRNRRFSGRILHLRPMTPLLDRSTSHQELLMTPPNTNMYGAKKKERKTTKIQFLPFVEVVTIPSHRDYTPKVRERLWSSFDEIQWNGRRNVLEFEADNFDWRRATEEDVFVGFEGERLHPETYRQVVQMRWEQEHPPIEEEEEAVVSNSPTTTTTRKRRGAIARIHALRAKLRRSRNGSSRRRVGCR